MTGASLLDRSFLCTHRKLISTMGMLRPDATTVAGMALMNATSLRLALTRTPTCQSRRNPGGWRAHCRNAAE